MKKESFSKITTHVLKQKRAQEKLGCAPQGEGKEEEGKKDYTDAQESAKSAIFLPRGGWGNRRQGNKHQIRVK